MSPWSFREKPLGEFPTNNALHPLVSPTPLSHRSSPARLPAPELSSSAPHAAPGRRRRFPGRRRRFPRRRRSPPPCSPYPPCCFSGQGEASIFPIRSPPEASFPDGGEPELALSVINLVHLAFNLVHEAGRRQIPHLAANLVHLVVNLVRRQKLSTFPRQQPSPPSPPQPLLDAGKRNPQPEQQLELLLSNAFDALAYNLQVLEGAWKHKGEEFGSATLQIDKFQSCLLLLLSCCCCFNCQLFLPCCCCFKSTEEVMTSASPDFLPGTSGRVESVQSVRRQGEEAPHQDRSSTRSRA